MHFFTRLKVDFFYLASWLKFFWLFGLTNGPKNETLKKNLWNLLSGEWNPIFIMIHPFKRHFGILIMQKAAYVESSPIPKWYIKGFWTNAPTINFVDYSVNVNHQIMAIQQTTRLMLLSSVKP